MRQKLSIAFLLTLILDQEAKAQNNKLHLYANFGAKQLKSHQFFYKKEITPAIGSALGAGSLFQKKIFFLEPNFII